MKAKKSLGQNFLINEDIINKIVSFLDADENDLIIEIGPGRGALTKKLSLLPSRIICIEVDTDMKPYLDKFTSDHLKVVYSDVLQINFPDLLKNYKFQNLYVIGNLPYYITSPIVEKLTRANLDVKKMIFMVQREVAERYTSLPGKSNYGYMTVFLQHYYHAQKVLDVPRQFFAPVPKVDSAIIELEQKKVTPVSDEQKYFSFVKECFHLKRKNLKNNLQNYDLKAIDSVLKKYSLSLSSRAEDLSEDIFNELYNTIYKAQ